jgi:hypothetical protein
MQIRNTGEAWRLMRVLENLITFLFNFWFGLAEEARDSLALCGGHKKKGKR